MLENAELGYTPANLRALREKYGLTQKQVAEVTATKNYVQAARWEVEPASGATRADMPLLKWRMLLDWLAARDR